MGKTLTLAFQGRRWSGWSFGEIQIPGFDISLGGGGGDGGGWVGGVRTRVTSWDVKPASGPIRSKAQVRSETMSRVLKGHLRAVPGSVSYCSPLQKTKQEEFSEAWFTLKTQVLDVKVVKDSEIFI